MDPKSPGEAAARIFRPNHKLRLTEVRALLEQGVHPDDIVRPGDKWPLLACMSERPMQSSAGIPAEDFIRVFAELVRHGASVNNTVRGGQTPLSLLCHAFPSNPLVVEPMLQCLLEAGADTTACKDSPFCHLIGFGPLKGEIFGFPFNGDPAREEVQAFWRSVQRLLDAGADINAFEQRGLYNPVLMTAACGDEQALQRFVELGAAPNVVNKDGNTALMYAAGDADGLASISSGIRCVWSRRGDTLAVTRLLLARGADPAASNNRKRTALGIALRNECFDVAFELALALSARQLLTGDDVKGFKDSAFEEQAGKLAVAAAPRKTSTPKDSSGAAQLASWHATAHALEGTEGGPVFGLVRDGLNPVYQRKLHATASLSGFYLSVTKNFISRKGCIAVDHAAWAPQLRLRYQALGKEGEWLDDLAERTLPVDAALLPERDQLLAHLIEMIREHLNVEA